MTSSALRTLTDRPLSLPSSDEAGAHVAAFSYCTAKTWQLVSAGAGLYLLYQLWMISDSPNVSARQAKEKSRSTLNKLGKPDMQLSEHEAILAAEIVHADQLSSQFEDVGGLEETIEQIQESVIYPLVYPQLFDSAAGLFSAPKGVLLYGPPGCGKTLLARAIARESGASFINIRASVLQDKWFGESNKLVSALFSLARKVAPSVIFLDEIDSFLRERSSGDHEASAMLKAEFMSSWDGLLTENDRILVLGATNRPADIDAAILRRMPKKFAVPLPGFSQRKSILALLLRDIPLDSRLDLDILAKETTGLSGSDLKELCRQAAGAPVKEQMRRLKGKTPAELESIAKEGFSRRPLTLSDFDLSMRHQVVKNDMSYLNPESPLFVD